MPEAIANLYLVIAQECNLRCAYCYADGGDFGQATRRMSEATLERALARLLPLAAEQVTVSFFGGEPLLAFPLIETAVARAEALADRLGKRVAFSLTSNGTLIETAMLPFLKAHIAYLAISLDGDAVANGGRLRHDGLPSFGAVTERLAWLRAEHIPFALRATLTPANVDRALETADFLVGLGATSVRMLPAHGVAWPAEARRRLREATAELHRRGLRAVLAGDAPAGCEHLWRHLAWRLTGEDRQRPCLAGGGILAVAADGTLYPCEHFVGVADYAMGHVDDAELPGPAWLTTSARFNRCTVANRPRCAACALAPACGGQCYAEAHAYSPGIERPDPRHCALVRSAQRALEPELACALADQGLAARLHDLVGA